MVLPLKFEALMNNYARPVINMNFDICSIGISLMATTEI